MSVSSYLILLVYFLLANLATVILSKKTFAECLPLTMLAAAFSLYISQLLFKTFNIGFYINIIYSLFPFAYIAYNHKNKDKLSQIKKNFLTTGFYYFVIVLTIITVYDLKRPYTTWDEFSHWGEMLKEMIRLDKFYSVSYSVLQVHKDYPPILQLFELFIIKLLGTYKETYSIVALHLLSISLIGYVIPENIKLNKLLIIARTIISTLLVFLVTLLFDVHGIANSIYNDYFMSILVAYIVMVIFLSDNKKSLFTLINISVASSFLLLTKQMGLPLYLMSIFLYFCLLIVDARKENKKVKSLDIKSLLKIVSIIIVIPAIFYISWKLCIKNIDIPQQFNVSDIKILDLLGIARGTKGTSVQHQTVKQFIYSLTSYSLVNSVIPMPFIQSIVFIFALLYLLLKKSKEISTIKSTLLLLTLVIGTIGYVFVMLNMYIFCFSEYEASILASFDRYMATFVLLILYICIMLAIVYSYKKKNIAYILCPMVIVAILISPDKINRSYPALVASEATVYEKNAQIIRNSLKENAKVFIIAQNSLGNYQYFVKYYANPIITNMINYNWPVSDDINPNDYYDSIKENISEYDYLYIASLDDAFTEKYSFVFETAPQEGQLYKIDKDQTSTNYKLVLIN